MGYQEKAARFVNENMAATVLTATVRELRESLGLTQQEFAHRLKKAISTVIRYETTREPRGKALIELAEFASANGKVDLSRALVRALEHELGTHVVLSDAAAALVDSAESTLAEMVILRDHGCYTAESVVFGRLYKLLRDAIEFMPEGERRDHFAQVLSTIKPAYEDSLRDAHRLNRDGVRKSDH